jgi:hypothetical protein
MKNLHLSALILCVISGILRPYPSAAGDPATSSSSVPKGDDQVATDLKGANAARLERDTYVKEHSEDDTFRQLDEKFRLALQKVRSAFPLIDPPSETSTNRFTKLTVNKRGLMLDGFRFKNASDEPKTFVWAFASGNALVGWYIVPSEGSMNGFTEMWQDEDAIANAPWGAQRPVLIEQSLRNTKVMPGKEYIIWFSFRDDKPHNVYVTFGLFPAADPLRFKPDIKRALQLR